MPDFPLLTTNCFLNGKPYTLHLTMSKLNIALTLTSRTTLEKWKSTSSVEYIESMTRKTGNFKTFTVFAGMMKAVFLNSSASLSIKLLTQSELEKLNDQTLQANFPETLAKRRIYFILVYTSEFDRIHYPLPMDYAGFPNPEILQATIYGLENDKSKLIKELQEVKAKSDGGKSKDIGTLKRCLLETANQCTEIGMKFQNVLEEFEKLKTQVDEDRDIWLKELREIRRETDENISALMAEIKPLTDYGNSFRNAKQTNKFPIQDKKCGFTRKPSASNSSRSSNWRKTMGRGSDTSADRSRCPSPGRTMPISRRSNSPMSTAGDLSSSSIVAKRSIVCNTRQTPERIPNQSYNDTSDPNEVNSVRLQIEALQRAVLGLSTNFNPQNN